MRPYRFMLPLLAVLLSLASTGCGKKTTNITNNPPAVNPASPVTTGPTAVSTGTTDVTTLTELPECPEDDPECEDFGAPVCPEDDQACLDMWKKRGKRPTIIVKNININIDKVVIVKRPQRKRRWPPWLHDAKCKDKPEDAIGDDEQNDGEGITLVDAPGTGTGEDASPAAPATAEEISAAEAKLTTAQAAVTAAEAEMKTAETALDAAFEALDKLVDSETGECKEGDAACKAAGDKVVAAQAAFDEVEKKLEAAEKAYDEAKTDLEKKKASATTTE